jgi:hypothetical protein
MLHDVGVHKGIFQYDPNSTTKKKIYKCDYIQLKIFFQRNNQDWPNYLQNERKYLKILYLLTH